MEVEQQEDIQKTASIRQVTAKEEGHKYCHLVLNGFINMFVVQQCSFITFYNFFIVLHWAYFRPSVQCTWCT